MKPSIRVFAVVLALCPALGAQWLKFPTPGVPRTADGKPNLAAPAPRTPDGKPDFSGVWQLESRCPAGGCADYAAGPEFTNLGAKLAGGLPYRPWSKQRSADFDAWTTGMSRWM